MNGFSGDFADVGGLREVVRRDTGILVDEPTLLYILRPRALAEGSVGVSRAYAATLDDGATVEAGGARAADADRGEAVARVVAVALVAALAGAAAGRWLLPPAPAPASPAARTYTITRARDGDTVELDGGLIVVRLAGVDTPETWDRVEGEWRRIADPDPHGVAAAAWTRSLIGRRVTVRAVARDRYGRTIAHLRLHPDGPDLAEHIRARGWDAPSDVAAPESADIAAAPQP
jgi:endonuclease YncB( thermonuclease family)